jgi:hypothetical protein
MQTIGLIISTIIVIACGGLFVGACKMLFDSARAWLRGKR